MTQSAKRPLRSVRAGAAQARPLTKRALPRRRSISTPKITPQPKDFTNKSPAANRVMSFVESPLQTSNRLTITYNNRDDQHNNNHGTKTHSTHLLQHTRVGDMTTSTTAKAANSSKTLAKTTIATITAITTITTMIPSTRGLAAATTHNDDERTNFGTNELWNQRTNFGTNERTNFGTNERTSERTNERTNGQQTTRPPSPTEHSLANVFRIQE